MSQFEPPRKPDDTEPTGIHFDDTNPTQPIRPQAHPIRRVVTIGVVIIIILAGAGVFGLTWLRDALDNEPEPINITVTIDGQSLLVDTFAETVSELFVEQNIVVEAGDRVSHALTAPIVPDIQVEITHARTVAVTVDGNTTVLRTLLDDAQAILDSANVVLNDTDRVLINDTLVQQENIGVWTETVNSIVVQSAITFQIQDGDAISTLTTTQATVGEALFEAGVTLFLADTVTPDVSATLDQDMVVVIERAQTVNIIVDGETISSRTTSTTVGEVLSETGIMLNGLDYSVPAESVAIQPGISVRVIRVTEELVSEDEIIPYDTVLQADPSLNLDTRQTIQGGQAGIQRYTYRVRYENGREVSRNLETNEQVQSPQNEVVAYGTNIVVRALNTPNGTVEYWRRLRVYATSYHPAALGGDNVTATGELLRYGVVATDPTVIPYYTNVYVEGYGTGVVYDTGGPRTTPYWIDLGYSDDDFVGWSRWMDVYILLPIPETVNYLLPQGYEGGALP